MQTVSDGFDAAYWQARYATPGRTGWDAGRATPPLRAYFDQLLVAQQPRILIPGAGRAHEAEYLHRLGFRYVVVADLAPEPLAELAARVPDFPKENLWLADFFALDPANDTLDLIIEQTFFLRHCPRPAAGLRPAVRRAAAARRQASRPALRYRVSQRQRAALRRQPRRIRRLFSAVF
jgi:hypothetical protein